MKAEIEITEEQKLIFKGLICPYCLKDSVYVDSKVVYGRSYGMIYLCKPCRAYVGVHRGTNKALGRLAKHTLRQAKMEAHKYFDQIWKRKIMSRKGAYDVVSEKLNIPRKYTHIGMLSTASCKKVVEISKDILRQNKVNR